MTLTKRRIVENLCKSNGLPKWQAVQLVEALLKIIKSTLEKGEDVLISGFGKFGVREKNERKGRNPQTGNDLTLGSRRVVTFRWSPSLKGRINGKG
jgi:integration host factor subunit alpha